MGEPANKVGFRNRIELLKIAMSIYIADKKYARTDLEINNVVRNVSLSKIYDEICSIINAENKDVIEQVISAINKGHMGLMEAFRNIR